MKLGHRQFLDPLQVKSSTGLRLGVWPLRVNHLREVEEWRPVPIERFAGLYEVSNFGRVRSLHARHREPKILAKKVDEHGYHEVCLCRDNKPYTATVRRLVALAFHPDKRNVLHREIAHLDGTRTNDRADNLKWVSHAENISHKAVHGTAQRGEAHPGAKLNEDAVRYIRRSAATRASLAGKFGVTPRAIDDVRSRKNWKHVADDRG